VDQTSSPKLIYLQPVCNNKPPTVVLWFALANTSGSTGGMEGLAEAVADDTHAAQPAQRFEFTGMPFYTRGL